MRKSNTQKLDHVIAQVLKELRIDNKLKESRLIHSWQDVVGKTIAKYTEKLYVKNGNLYVTLKSSVVRNELHMLKEDIVKRLNEHAGEEIIQDIVFK